MSLTETDRRILTLLADTDIALTPAVVAFNIDRSRHWCNRRLLALRHAGVVNREAEGFYRLNCIGHRLVADTLDPEIKTTVYETFADLNGEFGNDDDD